MQVFDDLQVDNFTILDTVELANGTLVMSAQSPNVEEDHTVIAILRPDAENWQLGAYIELASVELARMANGTQAIFATGPIPVVFNIDKECPPDAVNLLETTDFDNEAGCVLRFMTEVNGKTYCGGTQGQIYRLTDRQNDGKWEWDTISPVLAEGEDAPMFESLTGFADDDLYAVGFGGQIWHYDGSEWSKKESPTNYILTQACTHKGHVYACGVGDMLVKGRGDSWEIISDNGQPHGSMFAIGSVNDTLVCTNEYGGAFSIADDKVDDFEGIWGTMSFSNGPSGLWASGRGGVTLFDGTDCKKVLEPASPDEEEGEEEDSKEESE